MANDQQIPVDQTSDLTDNSDPGTTGPTSGSGNPEEATRTSVPTEDGYTEDGRNLRREEGKIKKLTEELSQARKDATYKLAHEKVVKFIQKDPEQYKRAWMELEGLSEGAADAKVREVYPEWNGGKTKATTSTESVLPPEYKEALDSIVQTRRQHDDEIQSVVTEFLGKYPDLAIEDRQAIGAAAQRLEKKGLSPREALEQAKIQILEPEKFKQEGLIEGKARGLSAIGATTGTSGGRQPISTSSGVSEESQQWASKFGLSKEEQAVLAKLEE